MERAKTKKERQADDANFGIAEWSDGLCHRERHIVEGCLADNDVFRNGRAKGRRVSGSTRHEPDVAGGDETKFSRFPIRHDRAQCPGIQQEILGGAIDRDRHGKRIEFMLYDRASRRSVDLIWSTAEHLGPLLLLPVLLRVWKCIAPFSVGRRKSRIQT